MAGRSSNGGLVGLLVQAVVAQIIESVTNNLHPIAGITSTRLLAAGRPNGILFLSAVTLGEIQAGIERTREQDPAKAAEIEAWLERAAGAWNVLAMDAAAVREWAKLMHRQSDTLYEDAMIAATVRTQGLTVVTRNVADFKTLGVDVLDPFV